MTLTNLQDPITNSTIITNSQSIFNTSVNGESFNYYIHPGGDITGVGFNNLGNPINQQTVDSSAYESYIVSLFDQIDAVIDLDYANQITPGALLIFMQLPMMAPTRSEPLISGTAGLTLTLK